MSPAGVMKMPTLMSAVELLTLPQQKSLKESVTNSLACKKRVFDLLNAISDLQKGDLLAVLGLDLFPFDKEEAEAEENPHVKELLQSPTPEAAANLLERRLLSVYYAGEDSLRGADKPYLGEKDLGSARFDDSENP
jgi:hypothetical protein